MTPIRLEHRFPCEAARLYALVSDTDFDAGLLEAIAVDAEILSREPTSMGYSVTYRFRPRRSMPVFMEKTVGKTMEWTESRAWNNQSLSHRWTITPSVGGAANEHRGDVPDSSSGRWLLYSRNRGCV